MGESPFLVIPACLGLVSFPIWIAVCHFSFPTWNNMVRESLTMLQLSNFPADGSAITGHPDGVCMKKEKRGHPSLNFSIN